MGSIQKRPNGKYRARHRDPEGNEHSRHFDRKKDADRWLADQVVRLRDGTWVDPQRGRRTFGAYAQQWVDAQVQHRPSTAAATRARLRLHVLPRFGAMPMASIQRSDVQAWVQALTVRGLAPTYVEGLYRLLSQILGAAVDDGVLASSPCGKRRINLPQKAKDPLRIPTLDEVRAIVEAAPDHGAALVLTAAGTGMRISEITGLEVERIDFLRRQLRVDQQLLCPPGAPPHLGPVKTRASNRTLPIPAELAEVLATHLEGREREGLVFLNASGRPWRRSSLSSEWTRWQRKAGVEHFKFHHLRHFYASMLIAAGQSPKVIQLRLGHATIQETFDTYGHLWGDDEDRTREAVTAVLRTVRGLEPQKPRSEAY